MLKIIQSVADMQEFIALQKSTDSTKIIGFVPTMGALHDGHLALIKQAKEQTDLVVSSIFVNPTQFNNTSDFTHYPRTIESDVKQLTEVGCDVIFIPTTDNIYPQDSFKDIGFDEGYLGTIQEGAHRQGHFKGVASVVKRLFDIVQPNVAFFGQKDYQQWLIINKMVNDFHLPVTLKMMPTLRHSDGLAMSSRNARLTESQRQIAPFIHEVLAEGKKMIIDSSLSISDIKQRLQSNMLNNPHFTLDYIDICSMDGLTSLLENKADTLHGTIITMAAYLGDVRLIDNILITPEEFVTNHQPSIH